MRSKTCAFVLAAAITGMTAAASAQEYAVGQTVEANMGSGPWMVCMVAKHNVKQTDYEVSCPPGPPIRFERRTTPITCDRTAQGVALWERPLRAVLFHVFRLRLSKRRSTFRG